MAAGPPRNPALTYVVTASGRPGARDAQRSGGGPDAPVPGRLGEAVPGSGGRSAGSGRGARVPGPETGLLPSPAAGSHFSSCLHRETETVRGEVTRGGLGLGPPPRSSGSACLLKAPPGLQVARRAEGLRSPLATGTAARGRRPQEPARVCWARRQVCSLQMEEAGDGPLPASPTFFRLPGPAHPPGGVGDLHVCCQGAATVSVHRWRLRRGASPRPGGDPDLRGQRMPQVTRVSAQGQRGGRARRGWEGF